MVDLEALTPAELARQLGHPEGEVGLIVAESLNSINHWVNEAIFHRLGLDFGSRVLELGFGNGHLIPGLMRHARGMSYVGIDKSPTMVDEAMRFNRTLVASGQAAFHCGSAEDMPFPDSSFDRAFGAGVVYFWAEPVKALAEIRRVLRSGGKSILASMLPRAAETKEFARPEFGFRVYDGDALIALHQAAGFSRVVVETYEETENRSDGSTGVLRVLFTIAEA
ncbi:MAG: class I SAM-dependent methyltransferase [Microvirga sp.]